jgi:hypothetical protein
VSVADPTAVGVSWSVVVPGVFVGDVTATESIVAVSLIGEQLVIGLDRATGVERWRREMPSDAAVTINTNGSWVVVATRQPPNLATMVEIDQSGNERFGIEFDADAFASLNVRQDGLYESGWLVDGVSTRVLVDPATGKEVDRISGVAFDDFWGDLVLVEPDGAVFITRAPDGDREPTGVVLDPNVQAVALVADQVVAYQDDQLRSFALDGSEIWRADYDGDFMFTTLRAVAPGSSRLAVSTSERVDVIDVATQTLVMSTTMPGAAQQAQWPDRLVATVEPTGSGSVGLLDFTTGTISVSQRSTGRLVPDTSGLWLEVRSIDASPNYLVGLTPEGASSWVVTLEPDARYKTIRRGAVVLVDNAPQSTVTFYDFPPSSPP